MATVTRRPPPKFEREKSISSRVPLSEKTKNTTVTTVGKIVDPLEKRLNHIRTRLLNNTLHKRLTHEEPTLIFDKFLYLGGLKSLYDKVSFICLSFISFNFSNDKNRVTRRNITHILSVVWIRPKKDYIPSNVKHLFIKADDTISFNIAPYFDEACRFIEEARQSNGRVLVHCACGVSRSTTLCCAYLMKYHSMTLEEALIQIRSRRPIVQPNTGFLRQLIHYNEQIEHDKADINTITERLDNV